MKPTPSQIEAKTKFEQWLLTSDKYFTLRAGAGRGKSWTTLNLLLPMAVQGKRPDQACTVLATTNQACDSLSKLLEKGTNPIGVTTLHKYLGCSPSTKQEVMTNPKGFEKCGYFMANTLPRYNDDIIFIDEAFRIDQTLIEIMDYLLPSSRFVFIGDPYQTPPIGLSNSPIEDCKSTVVTLNETPRFKQFSPLSELVDNFLLAVQFEEKEYLSLIPQKSDTGISVIPKKDLQTVLNTYLFSKGSIDYTEFCILAATRKQVDAYNNYCIQTRAKAGLPVVKQTDPIVIDTVIGHNSDSTLHWIRNVNKIPQKEATKGTYAETLNFIKDRAAKYADFLSTVATPVMREGNCIIYLLSGDGGKGLNGTKLRQLWAIQKELGISFVFVRLSVAKTIHLAQGITSSNVYVHMESILKWHDDDMKRRLLYTAFSRCSDNLFLMR